MEVSRSRSTRWRPEDAVSLENVNGSMTAVLPATLDGDVQLSTVNGRVRSDFPIGRR